MAKSKHSSSSAGGDNDAKHEQKLQGVLLADSFTKTFRPLSLDHPKVLSPLNNVPLLEYALEFLAGAGVEELFVVCVSNEVEEYIQQRQATTMQVACVKDTGLTNAGDALRELDKRNLVQSDPFVLMYGDVVTNVNLVPVIEAHKKRHKQDNSAIMTVLFKEVGGWNCSSEDHSAVYSSLRSASDDLVVAFDPNQENRILVYDDSSNRKTTSIPCSFFAAHAQADFRCDLLDCGIDICSPEVLARFSDEFDYRDIRREFVTNLVAEEEEGLQSKIFGHLLERSEYAARLHDFSTYARVSQDLLQRWCYPVVPDNNLQQANVAGSCRYILQRRYQYKSLGQTIKIGRGSTTQGPGMVGSHCHIDDNCTLEVGHDWTVVSGLDQP